MGHVFPNLLHAARLSARGKRFHPEVLAFHCRLEHELCQLHDQLLRQYWRPGPYRQFIITDPKKRLICAAPYRDRVVHHALVNVLEPIWARRPRWVFSYLWREAWPSRNWR